MTHYSNYKDFRLRKKLKKNQFNILVLKYLLKNTENSFNKRFKIMLKIQQLNQGIFRTKVKNRCMVSTKIRSVSRLSNLTKSSFKSNMNWGKLNGFQKSSW